MVARALSLHSDFTRTVPRVELMIHYLPLFAKQFPYLRLLSAARVATLEVVVGLRDRERDRVVHLHFSTAAEASHFADDVDHMRRVTQRHMDIQEQRKREAAVHGQAVAPGATPSVTQLSPRSAEHAFVPGQTGLSPFLGSLGDGFDDGSMSPHLSQLGSPRTGPLL